MKCIIGLGNPGLKYRLTRHNAGAQVAGLLAKHFHISFKDQRSLKCKIASGRLNGEDFCLVLPLTYMNLSGESVFLVARKHHVGLKNILVVSDDIHLELGEIRFREKGSSGGHKGLESVIEYLGSDGFNRLRVGVGLPDGEKDVPGHVLARFSKNEMPDLLSAVSRACEKCLDWLKGDQEAR